MTEDTFSLPRFRVPVARRVSNWELGEVEVEAPDDAAALAMVSAMDADEIDDLVTTETHTLEDEPDGDGAGWEPDPDREVTCIEPGGWAAEDKPWTFTGIKGWADQLKGGIIPRQLDAWVNPLRVLDDQTVCRRAALYLASIVGEGEWPVEPDALFALKGQLDRLARRGFRRPRPFRVGDGHDEFRDQLLEAGRRLSLP